MAKRLFMTTADYVTIALSPALVMLLVGSLVYFLIEVLYVGEYQARLMYVFALFVFAAVLVARIAIESGSEYASLFALPLGLAMFVVLAKFVEHPSPFSWLINLGLMCVVWWCAHQLTWDCTLIDDSEDASGEGLMQRIGADGETENELLAGRDAIAAVPWWRRWAKPKKGTHAPGVWVLYFSLAALPLFGIGQHWVPASDVGRRRYVFSLLLVYVAAALALLVTTSFLGLRRYLRQRRIEMPAPMAATWVAIGAVLIGVVMLVAALIPRPHAEYAISQVPWQAKSSGAHSASRHAVGNDGSEEYSPSGQAIEEDAPEGKATRENAGGEPATSDESKRLQKSGAEGEKSGGSPEEKPSQQDDRGTISKSDQEKQSAPAQSGQASGAPPQHSPREQPLELPKIKLPPIDFFAGALKLAFYAILAVLLAVMLWRNRAALAQALRDIVRQLQELFARLFGGRRSAIVDAADEVSSMPRGRYRTFAEYRDPFATGDAHRLPPEELVRYTFEAFEAWARDAGHPRSADQTPGELVRAAVAPQTPLHEEARRMVRLYGEVAYASGSVSPEAAQSLRPLWSLLQASGGQLAAR